MTRPFLQFKKIIERIENFKLNAVVLVICFSVLITLREILEQLFFEKSFSPHQLVHHYSFYSFVLMTGMLIISFIGKTPLRKAAPIVLTGFFLILLPPLLDYLFFGRTTPYEYILPKEYLKNMTTFFLFTPKAGLGIILEISAILMLSAFYVYIKTRSLIRSFLTVLSLYLLAGLSVTPRLYLFIPSMDNALIWQNRHTIYLGYYLFFCWLSGTIILYKINRNLPRAIIKELSSFRTLHFIFMVLIGAYLRKGFGFIYFPDCLYVLIGIIVIVTLWMSSLLINNYYDLPIDRISNPKRPLIQGKVSPSTYLNLGLILSLLALLESIALGIIPFGLVLIIIFSSLAYSMPPLRLRKRIFSPLFIGWGSFLAVSIGYFYTTSLGDMTVNQAVLVIIFYIFIGMSLGSTTKDLKDYHGDLNCGVKTFFTCYGLKKGKMITATLLFFSLAVPLLLFHSLFDIILLVVVSIVFSTLFFRKEKVLMAYLGYGIIIFYCLLRFSAIL